MTSKKRTDPDVITAISRMEEAIVGLRRDMDIRFNQLNVTLTGSGGDGGIEKRLRTVETDDAVLKTKVGAISIVISTVVSAIISVLAAVMLRR